MRKVNFTSLLVSLALLVSASSMALLMLNSGAPLK